MTAAMAGTWRARAMQDRMARALSSSLCGARTVAPRYYPRLPADRTNQLDSELLKRNDFTWFSFIGERHGFLTPKFAGGVRGYASGDLPSHEVVTMPALSPTMTQGNVGKWKKKEGDTVTAGEVLCDIETDKATLDLECMEDGVLAKILCPAGTKDVPVGNPLCIVAESNDGLEKFASYKGGEASSGGSQAPPSAPPPQKQQAPPPQKQQAPPSPSSASSPSPPPSDLPPHEVLAMPALSPTMTQGNVGNWKKKEGDKVSAGDVLCDIETDKATLDFESLEDGVLAKILMPGGSKDVAVGKALCVIAESEENIGKFANFSEGGGGGGGAKPAPKASPPKEQPGPAAAPPPRAAPVDLPAHQVLAMPALSPTMTQGNVGTWKKKEGEQVAAGDVLCDIETDKATLDFESLEDGYVAKIVVPSGSKDVQVGMELCIIAETAEDLGKFASYSSGAPASAAGAGDPHSPAPASQPSSTAKPPAPAPMTDSAGPGRLGPAVKKLLAESGLDASQIQGTGPRGAVVKGDVLAAVKGGMKPQAGGAVKSTAGEKSKPSKAATPDTPLSFEDIPNSPIRKIIAKRLLESKNGIPHAYLQSDTILDPTLRFRKELKEKHGISISVNDFVIKAAALALKEVPEANAFWDDKAGDRINNASIDISIAVATDKGLITPILKNADQKSLSAISAEVKSLAEKARQGKLKPQEFQGGTFSISNLGMFQVDHFCAIINPPQACILAVGRGVQKVVWDEENDGPKTVTQMLVTISVDHRVYDGDTGGRFLAAFRNNLGNPQRMLL